MNTLNLANNKVDGESTLAASEWNTLVTGVNTLITEVNNLPTPSGESDPVIIEGDSHVSFNDSKKNLTIETTETRVDGKGGHINIEPVGDFQIKPAGTEKKYTHHRDEDHLREYKVAVLNGANISKEKDYPVDLKVQAANLELNTEDKQNYIDHVNVDRQAAGKGNTSDDDDIFNIEVTTGVKKDDATRQNPHFGYLKVRARAIDLRCEDHGGIALQPRGEDGQHHMNKIKFEHGGGDGLEFGTFNTEKTSIFTNEYRFNKEGVWKMATRSTVASDNADANDPTTTYKYVKQADDFYDIINAEDAQTTTKDIIATANAMNNEFIETTLSSKKNLKISASSTYKIIAYTGTTTGSELTFTIEDMNKSYYKDELKLILSGSTKLSDYIDTKLPFLVNGESGAFRLSGDITPKISLEAEEEVGLDAKYGDVVLTSGDTIKMEAPEVRLNAMNADKTGGVVNFGATQDVMFINSKLTKGLKVEASANPTKVKQVLQNNTIDTVYWDETENIFRVPMKKIYANAEHTIEITPSNYDSYKEQAAYFVDGALIPADYTCFGYVTTENNGTYTTNVYKYSTKGSSAVLSKNYKHVGQYTSSTEGVLGSRVSLGTSDELTTLEFEFPTYTGSANVSAVQPEEFVTVAECELGDIIALVNYMKTNNQGPWA